MKLPNILIIFKKKDFRTIFWKNRKILKILSVKNTINKILKRTPAPRTASAYTTTGMAPEKRLGCGAINGELPNPIRLKSRPPRNE